MPCLYTSCRCFIFLLTYIDIIPSIQCTQSRLQHKSPAIIIHCPYFSCQELFSECHALSESTTKCIPAEDAATTACPTTRTKLAPLQNFKNKLKQHMNAQHRLGDANTDTGYYRWRMNMLSTANTKTSNTFWTNSKVTFEQKRNVMQFRKGTLYNQKIAYRNGKASRSNCLPCRHTDSHALWLSA